MSSLTPRIDKIDTNFLINGNFDFWQRIGASQLTVTANRTYGADRWMLFPSTASSNAAQMIRAVSTNTGSQYDMNFGPWSFNEKCAVAQIIENANTVGLRGQTVTFNFKIKSGGTSNVRAELLSWNGTANSVTAFNNAVPYTNWTTYTLASNFASLNSTTVSSNAAGYTTVTISGTVPTGCNNLICVIVYADNGGQQQYVSQAQLTVGNLTIPEFTRAGRTIGNELILCQRYYEKSYDIDTAVPDITNNGYMTMYGKNGQYASGPIIFSVTKRAIPTVTFYNPSTGVSGQARGLTGGGTLAIAPQGTGTHSYSIFVATAIEDIYGFQWTADAEL